MSDTPFDPTTHRSIQTRDGVITIPREQRGVPFKEYFQNAELPADPERTVIHVTPSGPVLSTPDPVPWNEQHSERATIYAGKIKEVILEKGYYSKILGNYAKALADETGHSREETKAIIVGAFEAAHGKDPFQFLQEQREAQGLPVRDKPQHAQVQAPEPEVQ